MSVSSWPDAPAVPEQGDVPSEPIWRLSVEQYHEMARAGILTDDDPVELLEGWLVYKMTKHPPHRAATLLLREALQRLLPEGWYVDSQEPVTTSDSEPEPDVAVIRGTTRDYLERHPGPGEVPLVAEVADSSLDRDRGLKRRIYARAGIAVYWIVNLPLRRIEVYSQPGTTEKGPGYVSRQEYGEADFVPVLLEGREIGRIAVRDVLP